MWLAFYLCWQDQRLARFLPVKAADCSVAGHSVSVAMTRLRLPDAELTGIGFRCCCDTLPGTAWLRNRKVLSHASAGWMPDTGLAGHSPGLGRAALPPGGSPEHHVPALPSPGGCPQPWACGPFSHHLSVLRSMVSSLFLSLCLPPSSPLKDPCAAG